MRGIWRRGPNLWDLLPRPALPCCPPCASSSNLPPRALSCECLDRQGWAGRWGAVHRAGGVHRGRAGVQVHAMVLRRRGQPADAQAHDPAAAAAAAALRRPASHSRASHRHRHRRRCKAAPAVRNMQQAGACSCISIREQWAVVGLTWHHMASPLTSLVVPCCGSAPTRPWCPAATCSATRACLTT